MSDETQSKVLSLVADIVKKQGNSSDGVASNHDEIKLAKKITKSKTTAIRGKPKSGRFWKTEKERFSTINKTKGLKQDFAKKTALRIELKRTKDLSHQVLEEFKQKQEEKKERRRENIKRSEENKRKAEVVQVITNSAKLKRMRKKQLRFIEKRDTNKAVEASK
ncbi:Coiled-coil domain-containing protein 86 [Operophtera brumata]|uniref:Coiled-coil domain-containing protein 86 n=1 Tax=Operophtera brumata TaxID=104452 RepID=A0A0L7KWN3_OPEBR|nr:Coiled-coil domain-containing protein 86 [Operophtera brumata]